MNIHVPELLVTWTDERVERLRSLYVAGKTAAAIAIELGGGITRNSVVGKIHRLGLNADKLLTEQERATRFARLEEAKRLRAERTAPKRKRQSEEAPRHSKTLYQMFVQRPTDDLAQRAKHIAFIDLEPQHCRFPYGLGPYTFCGHDKADGSTYCPEHHLLCCTEVKPRLPNIRTAHTPTFSVWA